jgi:xanthine dehydrogenase accessory factor
MADASHDLDAVLAQAATWVRAGLGVVLATVTRTWGSSPRPAGSKLAVNERGEFVGSVSGGCIEAAVITEGLELVAGRRTAGVLEFGVSDATAWEVGLACGGRVEVFIHTAELVLLEALQAARAAHQPVALVTWLDGRDQRLVTATDADPDELASAVAGALRRDQAIVVSIAGSDVLVEPHNPPVRLVVVGAVHVAQPLAEMARLAGFAVTIVDPRRSWATAARFPGLVLVTEWPDVGLEALGLDARTAVVTLTHDPKLDDPALIVALRSTAFYIGCLGSQKTHAARRDRLASAGFDATALDRLHGPVGLRIGARSPAEIAVSILADIIATLRGAT